MVENSNKPTPAEIIPSEAGEISGIASAHAPFVYFDGAPTFGHHAGVLSITLEAVRFMTVRQQLTRDRIVVAHLRMSVPAAKDLKAAIERALLLAAPAAGSCNNPKPN
jgi:hypothetical protein